MRSVTRARTPLAPELVAQLHPARNQGLDLRSLSAGSGRRLWWRCHHGHEWQAPVDRRKAGSGCPYCAGLYPTPETCLAAIAPTIAAQWHPTRNGARQPENTMPGSDRPAWWLCPHGHEWQAPPQARVSRGSGCPYCSGRLTPPERSLLALNPEIAAELHPTLNGSLNAVVISPGSSRRVWWRCAKGHEWQATVKTRVKVRTKCPRCAAPGRRGVLLAEASPRLIGEWVAALNNGPADTVTAGSHKRCWWRCDTDPSHLWRATVRNRVRAGSGCPYCAGKRATAETSLAAVSPELAGEWHPDRNGDLSPTDVLPQSNRVVWWRCAHGHQWNARVANRSRGSACPHCPATRAEHAGPTSQSRIFLSSEFGALPTPGFDSPSRITQSP